MKMKKAVLQGPGQVEVVEMDVPHHRRTEGVSKISGSLSMSLRVGAKMFYTLARERMRG